MGTVDSYAPRMAKQRYSPPNAEVAARINRVVELHRQWHEDEAKYKQALAEIIDPNGDDVPVAHMAALLEVERKTVYRHAGRSMT